MGDIEEKIKKLPKWIQDHITNLQRQRDTAVNALNEYCDEQTPSPFYTDDMLCTGEQRGPSIKKRYIQAHSIQIKNAGVRLRITLQNDHIYLQWGGSEQDLNEVAFVPTSFQAVRLIAKENMR